MYTHTHTVSSLSIDHSNFLQWFRGPFPPHFCTGYCPHARKPCAFPPLCKIYLYNSKAHGPGTSGPQPHLQWSQDLRPRCLKLMFDVEEITEKQESKAHSPEHTAEAIPPSPCSTSWPPSMQLGQTLGFIGSTCSVLIFFLILFSFRTQQIDWMA